MLTDIMVGKVLSLFSELVHALHEVIYLPIFTLFLSVAAPKGPSSQVETLDFPYPPPISETSFDDFAFPAIEDMMMLDQVISDKWISHLGRPLYEHLAFLSKC